MRYDAPFLVKRYAPMIGRPDSPRRITVAHQEYTLNNAIVSARGELDFAARYPWRRHGGVWVERRGQSALLKSRGIR